MSTASHGEFLTRRKLLHAASVLATSALVPVRKSGALLQGPRPNALTTSGPLADPDLHALALLAVDAARSAGAEYVDVRLTLTRHQIPAFSETEQQATGVRVLVNGTWGFLSSAVWTRDEVTRLARGAVAQAKAYSLGPRHTVDLESVLGPRPLAGYGEWVMPVKQDPFDIPIGEKMDVMNAYVDFAESYTTGIDTSGGMAFTREYKVFASSEGRSYAQTSYLSSADFSVGYHDTYHANLPFGSASVDFLSPAGRGWEQVSESGLLDRIPELIDFAEQTRHQTPVDVGRYDIVFSAPAMATLLDQTIGAATELDRALGYEADAEGTSYLNAPLEMLGMHTIGSKLITITANRSFPGGAATVKWDDEGNEPEPFTLVQDGTLVDYQTTRESAIWLAPYYRRISKAIRSHGCASAGSGLVIPLQHSPNLQLMPGKESIMFDDLVAQTEKGIAVYSLNVTMDQQCLNGIGDGLMREIKHGKLGNFIRGGALVFRTPELWKNLVALGGPKTVQWTGLRRSKGQPIQSTTHSVGAVPAKVTQLSLIDIMRKA